MQHGTHFFDKLAARNGNLRHAILDPVRAVFNRLGHFRSQREILERHFAFGALVSPFDHGDGRAALVGIFQLVAEFLVADIGLGANSAAMRKLACGSSSDNTTTSGASAGLLRLRNAERRRLTPMEIPVAGTC